MLNTTKAQELDTVKLLVDVPEYGLKQGDLGVVLQVYLEPEEAYDLEFVDEKGTSSKLAFSIKPSQIENTDREAREAYNRGMKLLQEVGMTVEAERELKRAIELRSSYKGGLLNSILYSVRQHRKWDFTIELLRFVYRLAPDYQMAKDNLAIAYLNYGAERGDAGDIVAAQVLYNHAIALDVSEEILTTVRKNLAATFTAIGSEHQAQGNYDNLIPYMRMARAVFPDDKTRHNLALAHAHLALFYMNNHKYAEAIPVFEAAEEAGLIHHELLNDYGIALIHEGRLDEAARALERALELAPDNDIIKGNLEMVFRNVSTDNLVTEQISISYMPLSASTYEFQMAA